MSTIYNIQDMALVSTKPEEVVDIGEPGGTRAHLVVEKTGGGSVTIEGAADPAGAWEYSYTVTVPAEGQFRCRIPLDMPKYIRLSASGAKLSVRG